MYAHLQSYSNQYNIDEGFRAPKSMEDVELIFKLP